MGGTQSTADAFDQRFKPYPEYKDSGIEWLKKIPAGWTISPLKRYFVVNLGKMLQNEPLRSDDSLEPYLRAANLSWDRVRIEDVRHMWISSSERDALALHPGDLLVSEGGDVGRSAIWHGEITPCYYQNAINRVRARGSDLTDFLFYWIHALKYAGYIDMLCSRATISHFTAEKVAILPVLLPPIEEQQTIINFLDRETTKIDALIAKKERLIELLQEKRTALIIQAVTKGLDPNVPTKNSSIEWLGQIPAHWDHMALSRLSVARCDGPFGTRLKSEHYSESGVRVVRLQNIGSGEFHDADKAYINEDYAAKLGEHSVLSGDLLVAGLGDDAHPVGRACVAPQDIMPAIVKADCFRFRLDTRQVLPRFAAYQLSATAKEAAAALSTGATRSRLNLTTMASREVILPPLAEQTAIVYHLDENCDEYGALVAKIREALKLLKEYRTALISAAVIGKIDVRAD